MSFQVKKILWPLLFSVSAWGQNPPDEFAEFDKPAKATTPPVVPKQPQAPPAPVNPPAPAVSATPKSPAVTPTPSQQPASPAVAAPAASADPSLSPTPAATTEPAAPKRPRRRRTGGLAPDPDYPSALYFDIFGSKGLPPMHFDYDLSAEDGKTLLVGDVTLNDSTFFFGLAPLGRMMGQYSQFAGDDTNRNVLVIRYPEQLLNYGLVEMISRSGTVIWKYEITEKDIENWKIRLASWQRAMNISPKATSKPLILTTQMGIFDPIEKGAPFNKVNEWFRFCISKAGDNTVTRLCSGRYMVKKNKDMINLARQVATDNVVRVLVKNEEGPLKNTIPAPADKPIQFYADLASGVSYEFVATPPKINIADMGETKDPNYIRVIGWDIFPTAPYRDIKIEQYGRLTEMLGFQATIKDTRKFWQSALSIDEPHFYFPGEGGGIFRQPFDLSLVPPANARVFLHKNSPKGTYSNKIYLQGRKHAEVNVASEEWSAENEEGQPNNFSWDFKAGEAGEINRSYLLVNHNKKTYRSYFEIYRSYSHELSGRFTGVYAGNQLVIMGEVAYNYWIETLFGWNNYYLSRQRWGINTKYFKSFSPVPASGLKVDKASLDVTVLDLKYRLTPGLWTRDETLGAIASYQNYNFGDSKAPMAGIGAFWARSMPAVFDRIFNWFPFMDYPKWVDMEFIYYVAPLKNDIKLTSSFSLNFHGQVLWKKNFFGEAGFGMKKYGIVDASVNQKSELSTFYGTVGLGLKF